MFVLEGMCLKVIEFKFGFYYIVIEVNVFIVLCVFDWGKGEVCFDKFFYFIGNKEVDFEYFYDFFDGVVGFVVKDSFMCL